MRVLHVNSAQAIVADEGVFYLLNRSGAYVCDSEAGDFQFLNLSPTPSQVGTGGKSTWKRVGWSERHIVLMDNQDCVYQIPRHQKDFPATEPSRRHRIGYISIEDEQAGRTFKQPLLGEPKTYRYRVLEAVLVNNRYIRRKAGVPTPDPEPFFKECFRVRHLLHPKLTRYTRTDKWCDREIKVYGGADKVEVAERSVAVLDDKVKFQFFPGEPLNDVCFSTDGLVVYMLYQNGNIVLADVD